MIAIRTGGTFLTIAAARQAAALGSQFNSGRIAEAAAALVTGTLAVLVWLRSRQIAKHQMVTNPTSPTHLTDLTDPTDPSPIPVRPETILGAPTPTSASVSSPTSASVPTPVQTPASVSAQTPVSDSTPASTSTPASGSASPPGSASISASTLAFSTPPVVTLPPAVTWSAPEPGPAPCSMLRRLATAVLFGLTAGFLAPGPVAATVFAAAGFACGYIVAGRSAAAKAEKVVQRRLAAAPPAIELFAAGLAAGMLPEQAANAVVDAFGQPDPTMDPNHHPNPNPYRARGRCANRNPNPNRHHLPNRHPCLDPSPRQCRDQNQIQDRDLTRDLDRDPLAHIAETFRRAASILANTADPNLAWEVLRHDPATEPVGTAALRSSRTGAPIAEAVNRAARATRVAAQQAAQGQVRSVAVKAVAPLAVCFLPAFVLIGIVPTALGLLHQFQH